MPRVKGGFKTRRRRKAILKLARGYYGGRSRLFRTATEAVDKAASYAYRDRRARKRDFRGLWIARINAAARLNDISYSTFISGLRRANILLNRKVLSDIAVNNPSEFSRLASIAKGQ